MLKIMPDAGIKQFIIHLQNQTANDGGIYFFFKLDGLSHQHFVVFQLLGNCCADCIGSFNCRSQFDNLDSFVLPVFICICLNNLIDGNRPSFGKDQLEKGCSKRLNMLGENSIKNGSLLVSRNNRETSKMLSSLWPKPLIKSRSFFTASTFPVSMARSNKALE